MSLPKAVKFLKVNGRDVFAVPDVDAIIRIGRIPSMRRGKGYWIPIWKISSRYNERQVQVILKMISKRLSNFAIAFENESNYLILSDEFLDADYAGEVLSKIKKKYARADRKKIMTDLIKMLKEEFGIDHITVQVEDEGYPKASGEH